ncbi:hypothetical protein CVU76_02935 [Candidatus Dojkabacteria bacterium HGW-Dojkabacteria-1]|uniref:Uncharacterized protein n=1 Tax=Candidatus Dojkabacteria bacterium HGW-Dojkabacteria-1 TaxID=2013761 RepID=A0A2N2F412_9BACT|nr:MAG: hypothetical protein CVU76_02935 [Candidatus Dojkabacteria bacterium HGW-Dojkabacteria-1]
MDPHDPIKEKSTIAEVFDRNDFTEPEIEGLSCAISVYVKVFSRPPFSENWTIEQGGDSLAFLTDNEIENFNPDDETHLYRAIKYMLMNPDKVSTEQQGEEEILEIETPTGEFSSIRTIYPFTSILHAYSREAKDPNSMVLIGYYDTNEKQHIIDITEQSPTDFAKPKSVTRVRHMESQIGDKIIEEIGYYLPEGGEEEIRLLLKETPTAYLGEIATITEGGFMFESIKRAAKKFAPLPDQFVMFTKEGSATIRTAEEEDRLLALFSKVLYLGKELTLQRKQYLDDNGKNVFVNIYQVKNDQLQN